MKKRTQYILIILLFSIAKPVAVLPEMVSAGYQIPASVLSGGGATMSSSKYQTTTTLGQSMPLSETVFPPESDNYFLLTGFWSGYQLLLAPEDLVPDPEQVPETGSSGGGGGGCFLETLNAME